MKHTIICLSSQRWDEPMWTNKQHIMSRLSREHRVIHVDFHGASWRGYVAERVRRNPRTLLRPWDLLTDGVVHRGGGLYVAGSYILSRDRSLHPETRSGEFWLFESKLWMLKRFLARERIADPIVWVYHPGYADALEALPRKLLVYDCVDEYSAFPEYAGQRWIVERERRLCQKADLVFTTSKTLFEAKRPWNPSTHLVENVGDADHFKAAMREDLAIPPEIAHLPRPIIGFVGAVSDYKLDKDWILHAAKARPNASFVLIGPVGLSDPSTNVSSFGRYPNIHVLGQRSYADLPAYIKGFDVAVIPYRISEYTRGVFPIKFFEFLATGKPVVISKLPSLEAYYDDVLVAETAEEFVARCDEALATGAEGRAARVALAEKNSWPKRIGELMRLIEAKLA